MKKYLISCLMLVLLFFSFLYYKRIDKISIYSRYETQFINKSSEAFCLNLYSNKEKSIYSNPNYVNAELYLNGEVNKLTLTSVETSKCSDLFKITYSFKMIEINTGQYEANFVLKTNSEKLEFDMGNIYFKSATLNDITYKHVYNLQDNIKEIHIEINNTNKIENVLINGTVVKYDTKYNNLQETQELTLYPYNNSYISSLLVNIDKIDYLVINDKLSKYYFIEALYDNI